MYNRRKLNLEPLFFCRLLRLLLRLEIGSEGTKKFVNIKSLHCDVSEETCQIGVPSYRFIIESFSKTTRQQAFCFAWERRRHSTEWRSLFQILVKWEKRASIFWTRFWLNTLWLIGVQSITVCCISHGFASLNVAPHFFFAPFPTHQQRLQGHFTNISTSPQKRAHRLIIEKLHSRGKWKVKKGGNLKLIRRKVGGYLLVGVPPFFSWPWTENVRCI